jgi:predicted membrane protein
METQNTNYNKGSEPAKPYDPSGNDRSGVSGRVFAGLIVILIGGLFLVREVGVNIPDWIFNWPMILIAIGVFIGVRHSFRGPAWFIMIALGTLFMVDDLVPDISLRNYIWPIALIAVGLIIIFRPKRSDRESRWRSRWEDKTTSNEPQSTDELLDSVNIFGGIKKNIISKNFRGGEVTTIFGGSELNLTQADVTGKIELEVTQIFGGIKLIVPPHWKIQSEELVSIFGGVDDKRPIQANPSYEDQKVLVLKGTNIFGGIDIKSY